MAEGVASFFASPYRVWQEGREERALDEQVAEEIMAISQNFDAK